MVQKELKLASFNVRGLTEDQKKVELAKDLKEKKVDIYAVVTVQKAAEEVVGYVQKMGKVKSDSEMERLSLQQKSLRLKIKQAQKHEKTLFLKKKRQLIVRKMAQRTKHLKENELDGLVEEAISAENSAKMFAAIRALKRKPYENPFVNDENGKRIVQADEIARVVESHFKNHFFKPEEVKRSVKSLKNGRACGHDNINVELLKYAPDKVIEIITRALNQIFEEHKDLDLRRGVLMALPKPGKCKGPIKNLRPITLFPTIRKILSIVTLNRIKPDCDSYLSTSQCAYRSGRSTTDVVWAYRWMIARAQKTKTSVFSTGIDLSSAFDTIRREKLLGITESFLDEDANRLIRVLISDTSMELRINGAKERTKFGTNIGSPQGDGLSGMLFNIYFEDALRHVRQLLEEESNKTEDHTYAVDDKPKEFVYADDSDFLSLEENDDSVQKIEETLKVYNLTVNVDKTEKIVIKRGERLEEFWRKSKKLGSLLGDEEDILRRKILARNALREIDNVWVRKTKISLRKRLHLYNSLVKPILLYNCETRALSKTESEKMDAFHRQNLRRVANIRYPHRISNGPLYRLPGERPISEDIVERRWRYLGHALRQVNTPPCQAMNFYMSPKTTGGFPGRPRTTIVTTISEDLKNLDKKTTFWRVNDIKKLENLSDLQKLRNVAIVRENWKLLSNHIAAAAKTGNLSLSYL